MTEPLDRPLDRAEAFFWFLDRCSSMNFAVLAEGSGPLQAGRLAEALARAPGRHPALACAISADAAGRLVFLPRPDAPVTLTRESAGEDWHEALATRLAAPFALGEAPLVRAHWFERPAGRWAFAVVASSERMAQEDRHARMVGLVVRESSAWRRLAPAKVRRGPRVAARDGSDRAPGAEARGR